MTADPAAKSPETLAEGLDAEADWLAGRARHTTKLIEEQERELDSLRAGRDEALRKSVERRVGAKILRTLQLQASLDDQGVPVSLGTDGSVVLDVALAEVKALKRYVAYQVPADRTYPVTTVELSEVEAILRAFAAAPGGEA